MDHDGGYPSMPPAASEYRSREPWLPWVGVGVGVALVVALAFYMLFNIDKFFPSDPAHAPSPVPTVSTTP